MIIQFETNVARVAEQIIPSMMSHLDAEDTYLRTGA